ncbi:MAG: hypothetical protein ACTS73_00075 [Arsenophonus sp. NEOnobi-MAG3]
MLNTTFSDSGVIHGVVRNSYLPEQMNYTDYYWYVEIKVGKIRGSQRKRNILQQLVTSTSLSK